MLRDVLKRTDKNVLRMLMLQTHYRSPLDFSDERLGEAEASLMRVKNLQERLTWLAANAQDIDPVFDADEIMKAIEALRADFTEAMDDDFNTAGALGKIFGFVNTFNACLDCAGLSTQDVPVAEAACDVLVELMGVFGVDIAEEAADEYPAEVIELAARVAGYAGSDTHEAVEALLEARATARKAKDWGTADAVRDGLSGLGFVIEDTPQGAKVSFKG